MTDSSTVSTTQGVAPSSDDDQDPHLADVPSLFEEGTFVLVGCGAAKRDPADPVDVHEAAVGSDENFGPTWTAETGPAWEARDLYTSTYFQVKRAFAEKATQWARNRDGWAWAILSAEHHIVRPGKVLKPYDTTIDDLGDDVTNPEHRVVDEAWYSERPDGDPLVTEVDQWALRVATSLQRWVTLFDEAGANLTGQGTLRRLIVLAGRDYVEPLRERKAFDGLQHIRDMHPGIPVEPTFLFEEIDADGIGEQMAWLSDAISQQEDREQAGEQVALDNWSDSR